MRNFILRQFYTEKCHLCVTWKAKIVPEQHRYPYQRVSFLFFCFLSADLGLDPTLVLTLHPIETTLPGTTEAGSEATTEAIGGRIITVEETEATTHVVITRTEAEVAAMATRAIGKVVVVAVVAAAVAAVAVEAGTIARTTGHTAPEGGAPAHLRSARVAGADLATPTARLRGNLGSPDGPVIPRIPDLHLHVIVAAKASPTPRRQRHPAARLRSPARQRAASSRRRLAVNGSTMRPVPNWPAQMIRRKERAVILRAKDPPVAAPCGKASAACLLQIRAPQNREKQAPTVVLASFQRKMPKTAIKM